MLNLKAALRALLVAASTSAVALPAAADWTGFYLGINAGWQNTDVDWTWVNAPAIPESPNHTSAVLGGHAGYQVQLGRVVVGLEGGLSSTAADGDKFDTAVCNVNATFVCGARLKAYGTIGPRLGLALNDNWLVYATGGYAYGHFATQARSAGANEITSASHNGWFAGGGIDWKLHSNLILGVEYQRLSFDGALHTETVFAGVDNRRIAADTDVIRARITLQFGGAAPAREPLK